MHDDQLYGYDTEFMHHTKISSYIPHLVRLDLRTVLTTLSPMINRRGVQPQLCTGWVPQPVDRKEELTPPLSQPVRRP